MTSFYFSCHPSFPLPSLLLYVPAMQKYSELLEFLALSLFLVDLLKILLPEHILLPLPAPSTNPSDSRIVLLPSMPCLFF